MKLPGSRTDIIRTQKISGPSPVGGSSGGTEGRVVQTLDEFVLQGAHYNIACDYARLGKSVEVSTFLISKGIDDDKTIFFWFSCPHCKYYYDDVSWTSFFFL